MTEQDDAYANLNAVDDVGNILGGDVARDVIKVALAFQDTDLAVEQVSAARQIDEWTAGTIGVDASGATIPVTNDGPLDASAATVPVTGDGPLDVSAATVPVEARNDWAIENGTAVASGGSTSKALAAEGAEDLRLRVSRATTSYDVTIDWENDSGTTIWTESVASGVAGGTETLTTVPAATPYATVTVADAGSGSGAVTATYNLR